MQGKRLSKLLLGSILFFFLRSGYVCAASAFARAVILNLDDSRDPLFDVGFVVKALEVYDITHSRVHEDGKVISGLVNVPPFCFQQRLGLFVKMLSLLNVQRLTIYRKDWLTDDYIIEKQLINKRRLSEECALSGLFDYYPETYFLVNEDTPYIAHRPEKKPGTRGSISISE